MKDLASRPCTAYAILFFVMKVDQKDISAATVLRDLEKIDSPLEPALPG